VYFGIREIAFTSESYSEIRGVKQTRNKSHNLILFARQADPIP